MSQVVIHVCNVCTDLWYSHEQYVIEWCPEDGIINPESCHQQKTE
jgi:hypothetical protein